jgi:hypothetical protein
MSGFGITRNRPNGMLDARHYLWEHYGDLASVAGLLLTLVGFVVTIWNVRRARRAAEEARQAAREAVARIGVQLLANEIGTALQLVREVDAACRDRNWHAAVYRGDEARIRLAHLLEDQGLELEERGLISSSIDDLGAILTDLQKLRDAGDTGKATTRIAKRLHTMITTLSRIRGRILSETLKV